MSIVKLTESQLNKKISIIDEYKSSSNAASASAVDANANVEQKNIATLEAEINKDINIQINREMLKRKIKELFGEDLSNEYIRQLESHEIYTHDESSLKPYTYGASEAIVVYKNNKKILTTFENLYSLYPSLNEELLDEKKGVWAKYPNDLYIDSFNGKTKITRLVKKERYRDMLRIKTKYGEDIVVTDNHPMIVGDDTNDTIEAKDCVGEKQYKSKIVFDSNVKEFDTKVLFEDNCFTDYGSFYMSNINDSKKVEGIRKTIKLSDKLGYVVGFFIAEGCYEVNGVIVVQNDETILKKIASYLYEETGIVSKIYKDSCPSHSERNTKYILRITSIIFKNLLTNYFQIKSYAENKNLPMNIFETNKAFVNGVISGIIDGDGSVHGSALSIRVASRSLITQLSIILKSFNVGFSNSYQEQKNTFMKSFSSNYPIFGVMFGLTGDLDFNLSEKVSNSKEKLTTLTRYIQNETIIKSVKKIKNEAFLDNFIYDITTENNEFICNNIRVHNCTSISLYPFLMDGLTKLGGESKAPQHLNSLCGNFVNLIFAVSSQFAGAVATVEFLNVFDYYARKDYGDNYLETHQKLIDNHLQHVVYAINQPAAARGYQSVFWNISIFDKEYFDSMFGEFVFPDFTKPSWNSLERLQEHFMKWFNIERTKAVLTFPVITAAMLTKDGKPKDEKFARMCAKEMSEGNSFFVYMSDNADSLSSCCRLRNEIQDNTFSYTLGAGGVMTGSLNVLTLNMNRLVQDGRDLKEQINKIHKYQYAYRKIMDEFFEAGLLTVYSAGFISLDKQFLTIGLNGLLESAEFLGYKPGNNEDYKNYLKSQLKIIFDANKEAKKEFSLLFNTEIIPGENLGIKNSTWDKKSGYKVKRDCYNSYFYKVEDQNTNHLDKFVLHGKEVAEFLDGGSALHLNLDEYLTEDQFYQLFCISAKTGCNYFTTNVKITICNDCKHIDKNTRLKCQKCGSRNVDYATRIIGYLKKISSWNEKRQIEESLRYYETCNQ